MEQRTTRDKILASAVELFSEYGYSATTTKMVAKTAGVNEITLFRHFKTKLLLFKEILKWITHECFRATNIIDEKLSAKDSIRNIVYNLIEDFEENPQYFRLLQRSLLDQVENFEEDFIKFNLSPIVDQLRNNFTRLQQDKKISSSLNPKIQAELLFSCILGCANSRVFTTCIPMKQIERKNLCEAIIAIYLK